MDDDVDRVEAPLARLRALAVRLGDASAVHRLLAWDERTMMPAPASESRARQLAWLAGVLHRERCGDDTRRVLHDACEWDAEHVEVRAMRTVLERAWRIPDDHVERASFAAARGVDAWGDSRARDDASGFTAALVELVDVARAESAYVDDTRDAWDVQLERWEPGLSGDEVVDLLERLAERIGDRVRGAVPVDDSMLDRPLDPDVVDDVERRLVRALGFDDERGRIDRTERAFCTKVGDGDVRITSRLGSVPGLRNLRSSLHEAGHAIYEQALHRLALPATIAHAPGLGLDESQSRLFERMVGTSRSLWSYHYPWLASRSSGTFGAEEFEQFVRALRAPAVGLVRIDSGDGAYDLHVLLRTRLERELLSGRLQPRDLPEAWDAQVGQLLGLAVPGDRLGCLQDIHWASGMWGYFPTYSLGNVWAAQLHAAARRSIPDLDEQLASTGSAASLVAWLDEHVYRHGRAMTSAQVVEAATGSRADVEPLVAAVTGQPAG